MMVMMMMPAHGLCEVLHVGQLATRGGVGKVGRELRQLVGRSRVSGRLGVLSGTLQVGRNLLSHLAVLSGVGLLQLLQATDDLGEWRKLAVIGGRVGSGAGNAIKKRLRVLVRDSGGLEGP